jgi:hypothetical protein
MLVNRLAGTGPSEKEAVSAASDTVFGLVAEFE